MNKRDWQRLGIGLLWMGSVAFVCWLGTFFYPVGVVILGFLAACVGCVIMYSIGMVFLPLRCPKCKSTKGWRKGNPQDFWYCPNCLRVWNITEV